MSENTYGDKKEATSFRTSFIRNFVLACIPFLYFCLILEISLFRMLLPFWLPRIRWLFVSFNLYYSLPVHFSKALLTFRLLISFPNSPHYLPSIQSLKVDFSKSVFHHSYWLVLLWFKCKYSPSFVYHLYNRNSNVFFSALYFNQFNFFFYFVSS